MLGTGWGIEGEDAGYMVGYRKGGCWVQGGVYKGRR